MSYEPTYKNGDWKANCDRCDFTFKASQLKETWDNLKVCKECWEPRQPQDFVRAVRDNQSVPWTRTEICPTNVADTELTWVQRTSGVGVNLRSVWYESGMWVICGDSGTILTSTNSGVTWTARTSGVSASLRTVKYWNGDWYIVGRSGGSSRATILKSSDGITWADLSSSAGLSTELVTIAFNDSTLVFGGWETEDFTGYALSSTDGTSFSSIGSVLTTEFIYGVAWNSVDSLWGIVGASYSGDLDWFGTSPDLSAWTRISVTNATGELWTVHHDGTSWIVCENLTKIYTSTDASTWTRRTETNMESDNPWRVTGNSAGILMISGGFVTGKIIISSDGGATWSLTYEADTSVLLMSKTEYGGSTWVGVGWNGRIVTGDQTVADTGIPSGTFTNTL